MHINKQRYAYTRRLVVFPGETASPDYEAPVPPSQPLFAGAMHIPTPPYPSAWPHLLWEGLYLFKVCLL